MLHRANAVQFNQNITKSIGMKPGIAVAASSNRKKTLFDFKCQENYAGSAMYPKEFPSFQHQQQSAHFAGVREAQDLVEKFVPEMKEVLVADGTWDLPYTYSLPKGCTFVDNNPLPDDYKKLDVSTTYANTNTVVSVDDNGDHDDDHDDDDGNDEDGNDKDCNDRCENNDGAVKNKEDDMKKEIEASDVESDNSDDDETSESIGTNSWFISRMVSDTMTKMNVSKALKIIMGKRECVKGTFTTTLCKQGTS